MSELVIAPAGGPLHGVVRPPGDKSVSHRALLLAALAEGESALDGLSDGDDVARTAAAMTAFGVEVERRGPGRVVVRGGRSRLHEPERVVDTGNSGTGIRLLAGWATGVPGLSVLEGDESIARRPMERVVEPLRRMGAVIDGRAGGRFAPLVVRGGPLRGVRIELAVASAQVKGAILLAALTADGPTTVVEPVATRIHTEEMLAARGVRVERHGRSVTVWPGEVGPADVEIPIDPSQAAFWVVAATLVPGSEVRVPRVYVGPGRAGFLEVLTRMGADIHLEQRDERAGTADLRVRHAPLRATEVGGAEVPSLIDEIPVLAVAAAFAEGVTTFRDAAELRVKETDRIVTVSEALRAMGATVEARQDGLVVTGAPGRTLGGGSVHSAGDHRVAMAAAVAALAGRAPVTVRGWDAVATSYPSFREDLAACTS